MNRPMNRTAKPRTQLAIKAALDIIGPCHPDTAAYLLLTAAAEHCGVKMGSERASELVYGIADRIATGKP